MSKKRIAKLLLKNRSDSTYLLLNRTDHPKYGADPDLPGGTHEDGEDIEETLIREVQEEIGVNFNRDMITQLYVGTEYSSAGNEYSLFFAEIDFAPQMQLSWEHSRYRWCALDTLIQESKAAIDAYMHMVADVALDRFEHTNTTF